MRLPRPRLRLWMLMGLVALVALGLAYDRARGRSAYFRGRAAYYARKQAQLRAALDGWIADRAWIEGQIRDAQAQFDRARDEVARNRLDLERRRQAGRTDDLAWDLFQLSHASLAARESSIVQMEQLHHQINKTIDRRTGQIEKHAAMERAFSRAARYPFLSAPIEPD